VAALSVPYRLYCLLGIAWVLDTAAKRLGEQTKKTKHLAQWYVPLEEKKHPCNGRNDTNPL
jgi:hypothetical protein